MADRTNRPLQCLALLLLSVTLFVIAHMVEAQTAGGRLVITGSDASSVPAITLQAYGVAADGSPLDLSTQSLVVTHNNEIIEDVEVVRTVDTGSSPSSFWT